MKEEMQRATLIPVYNMTLLPGITTSLKAPVVSNSMIHKLNQGEGRFIIVPLRREVGQSDLSAEDFHNYGVMAETEEGQGGLNSINEQVILGKRAEVQNIVLEGQIWTADYSLAPEIQDLGENSESELMVYFRRVIHEIGSHFTGSEEYIKIIDSIDDMNVLMVYMTQYMPISSEEKYELLKQKDPVQAEKIHPNNRRRVIRSLNIYDTSGIRQSDAERMQEHRMIYDVYLA